MSEDAGQVIAVGAGAVRVETLRNRICHGAAVLRALRRIYLTPLPAFFVLVMLANGLDRSEPLVILSGLGGFVLAGFVVRRCGRRATNDPASQPLVLRAMCGRMPRCFSASTNSCVS